jgi:uncharacterized coiled-coil DUF342 family protein
VTFSEFKESEKEIFRLKESAKSSFYKKVEGYFNETNNIKNDMLHFIKRRIDNIKRSSGNLLSRTIFQILHPPDQKDTSLYNLLDIPQHLTQMITHSNQAAKNAPLKA